MSPTSYQTAPPRVARRHPSRGVRESGPDIADGADRRDGAEWLGRVIVAEDLGVIAACDFDPVPPERERHWIDFISNEPFHAWLGFRFEEIRLDYARLRVPFRPELLQGGGVIHGGVLTTLLDTVAVAAVLSAHDIRPARTVTLDLGVQFLGGVQEGDVTAVARVRRRGRSIVFAEADAYDEAQRLVASARLTFMASS